MLKHTLQDRAFSQLNLEIPPSIITPDIFQGFKNATSLQLTGNGLSVLDDLLFVNFSRLEKLFLAYNHFEDFPALRGLVSLIMLQLHHNVLREPPRDLRWTTPKVRDLQLQHNKLKSVSGIHLPQLLFKLDLSENLISMIDSNSFKGLMYLEVVNLKHNLITKVGDRALLLPALDRILLRGNGISVIAPGAISSSLSHLNLNGDKLLNLSDLAGLYSLIGLRIFSEVNYFPGGSFPWLQNLRILIIDKLSISELISNILTHCPVLRDLSATEGVMQSVNLAPHSRVQDLSLNYNSIKEIRKLSTLTALVNLLLKGNSLTDVPEISHLSELRFIDLARNQITTVSALDFNNSTKLESIDLSYNKITLVRGEFRLSNLISIVLTENLIKRLDMALFSASQNIEIIFFSANKLTENTETLWAPALKQLGLQDNGISRVPSERIRFLLKLQVLLLQNNRISYIFSFPSLPRLTVLRLDNNPISYIANDSFLSIPKIEYLSLSNTGLVSLPTTIGTLRFMKDITLNQNLLTRIPEEIFADLPNLYTINLEHNQVSFIDRSVFFNLRYQQTLNILGNPVRTFDIGYFTGDISPPTNLKNLHLGSTSTEFLSQSMLEFIQQVPNVYLLGSSMLHIPSNILCDSSRKSTIVFTGFQIDYVNITCNLSLIGYAEFVDVMTVAPVVELVLSRASIAAFFNVTLMRGQQEVHPTYCETIRRLKYVYSGLFDIPALFAPNMTTLNVSSNFLTTLRLNTLTKYYPDLLTLDLSNNRIRVLSSCGVPDIIHPLKRLYLTNNDLGAFSGWKCGSSFGVLLELSELRLSGNDLSFLSKELVPSNLEEAGRYEVTVHASDNPLVCSCPQRWLLDIDIEIKGGECSGPPGLAGQDIQDLIHEGFPCAPSMFRSVELCTPVKSAIILVLCPVESFPRPQITWFLRDAGELIALDVMSAVNHTSENDDVQWESQQIEIVIDDEPADESDSEMTLMCRVVNDFGEMDILIEVHMLWDANGESGSKNISVTCDAYQREEEYDTSKSPEFQTTSDSPFEQDNEDIYMNYSSRPCFSCVFLVVIFSCINNLL